MFRRLPLYTKILAWFGLNLVLICVVAWVILQQQLRLGFDSLLSGSAGDRLRSVAQLVVGEVNATRRPQWDEVLARFDRVYPARFSIYTQAGEFVAGTKGALPDGVHERLARLRATEPMRSLGHLGRGEGPPPPRDDNGRPERGNRPPPPLERDDRPAGETGPRAPAPSIIGMVRDGSPARYWLLIRLPIARLLPDGPAMLIIQSDTLSAGGLIFDFKPLMWSGAAVILLCVLFWLPLIRSITHSLGEMSEATGRIAEGRFDVRVKTNRGDEIGQLGNSINVMAERIASLVSGQRRFLSDVAHELCAPLARLQMALAILEERVASADAERVHDVREEVDHMAGLVNELLSFSKASIGAKQVRLQSVPVRPLLDRVIRREAGEETQVEVRCTAGLQVLGDPDLMQRAVGNLLRNAIRYASHAGPIALDAVETDAATASIRVVDRGPGVPEGAIAQLFDPFYRVDSSRTRETGGVGLGLTIARTCVDACGGTITAENLHPNGLCVTIRLQTATAA